mmetsp:Transcript_129734/g.250206  ORF Transcript_129734/g.250206 Transcript_129734/m.250206 type:complete len:177 (-) Transcript_129734:47-577(-)
MLLSQRPVMTLSCRDDSGGVRLRSSRTRSYQDSSRSARMQNVKRRGLADFVTQTYGADSLRQARRAASSLDVHSLMLADNPMLRSLALMEASSSMTNSAPVLPETPVRSTWQQSQTYFPPWVDKSSRNEIMNKANRDQALREHRCTVSGRYKDGPWKERMRLEGRANPPVPPFVFI